jgi:hypothetical protein
MKKLLTILATILLMSCSTDETDSGNNTTTKEARVNIVSAFNLPTSLSVNNMPLPNEFHHGVAFEVETGDVIKASGRQIWISIDGVDVVNEQSYAEYVVE